MPPAPPPASTTLSAIGLTAMANTGALPPAGRDARATHVDGGKASALAATAASNSVGTTAIVARRRLGNCDKRSHFIDRRLPRRRDGAKARLPTIPARAGSCRELAGPSCVQ